MKKILLICIAVSTALAASTQTRFGIKGGLNLASERLTVSQMGFSVSKESDVMAGFHLGGVMEIPVAPHFSFRPELLLSAKGGNFDGSFADSTGTQKVKMRPFYLELPLNMVYHYTWPTGLKFYGGAGPSIAYGIFGKTKSGNLSDNVFQDGGFKRLDVGINLLAGLELKSGLTLGANFTPGLSNIYDGGAVQGVTDIKFKNTVFGLSVGYMFSH